jgi:ligand-binding sensor domain-containing protein
LWLATWSGGVFYYKDGSIQASWGPAQGLGIGRVTDLKLDADGSVWAATEGGLSRIKDGRVVKLNSHNGLPCDSVHDFAEDNTHTFWLYTACGLIGIADSELDRWLRDPASLIQSRVLDALDGARPSSISTRSMGRPRYARPCGRFYHRTFRMRPPDASASISSFGAVWFRFGPSGTISSA